MQRMIAQAFRLTQPIAFVGVLGMLVVSGVTLADVLSRWLAGRSLAATNEIVAMTFAVAVAACIPAGLAQGVNLRVDLLENRLAGRWKWWLTAIGEVLLALFFGLLAWRVAVYTADIWRQGKTTVILEWKVAYFIGTSAALLAIGVAVQILVAVDAVRRAVVGQDVQAPGAPAGDTPFWVKAFLILVGLVTFALIGVGLYDFNILAKFAQNNPGTTVTFACTLLWAILVAYVPLAAVTGLMGIVGTALYIDFGPSLSAFATEMTGFLTNANVAVLPLFLMMGSFAAVAGMADDAYDLAHALLGRFRGGLAMATIGGCAGFGAVTGSSVATAATVGRVALPEMKARGYSPALATGCIAAGGTLGNLVPPGSGPLVLFALLTEASIGQLFIASMIPAIVVVAAYILNVWLYVRLVPTSAPAASRAEPGALLTALKRSGPLAFLFIVCLGGMYIGVFTVTESAAIGAFGAFLVAVWRRKLAGGAFGQVIAETMSVTAMVYGLIFGGLIFSFFCEVSDLSEITARYLASFHLSPLGLIFLLLAVFIVLGTFMDSYAVMIATIPIVTPLVTKAGYDIVWWGVINLFVIEIGNISPPFGLNMFVLKSIDDTPLAIIFKGVTSFCIAAVVTLVILVLFPQITMWLPSHMTP